LTTNNEPEQRAYEAAFLPCDARASDKLVTYWGDTVKIIYPEELRPLEQNQTALKALVIWYANQVSEASD
jgi:hypothetical protein